MKAKKILCMILVVIMAAGLAAGCGGKNENTSSTDGGKSIVLWTRMENEVDVLQEWADKWGEETGNSVSVIVQKQEADIQQFSQAVKSADGPDGVFGIPNDQLANYVSANLVQEVPADLYEDADFVDAAIQASYVAGVKYGVPISVETPFLFYNTEKIAEVPETWEELIEVSQDKGGIVFEATSVYYNLGFLRAFGSYIFKYEDGAYDTSDIGLGNENAVKAYAFINKMASEYGFFTSDLNYDVAKSSFENGESAFYIGGVWDVDGFTSAGVPFGVSDMPTLNGNDFVTPVGTYVGFVSSKSDKQEEVFALYKYLIENALGAIYEVGERIPATLEAQEAIEKNEVTQAHIDQIAKGEPMPTVSEMGLIWQPFEDNMKLMFEGTITPEEAAGYISEQVEEAIELMNSGK